MRIIGYGAAVPSWVLTNADVVARTGIDWSPDDIERKTGIRSRHWLEPDRSTSDLAADAGARILADAGVAPAEVDALVLCTMTPDHPSPATAPTVARKLGIRGMAFDLHATCAGFLYGLEVGAGLVRSGRSRVLVLAAEVRSRSIDPTDPRTVVLFSDAAAGVVLGAGDGPGTLRSVWTGSEGRENVGVMIPAGGTVRPIDAAALAAGDHYVKVESKRFIFDTYLEFHREAVDRALAAAAVPLDAIALFVTHQGNANLVVACGRELGLAPERVWNNIAVHGNSSGSTLPLALA
ncbi:MAG: ketoacyl-ACP synthase III, partial [Myxococcota bacterium]